VNIKRLTGLNVLGRFEGSKMIVIVDYGIGNLGSVLNMLRESGADASISSGPSGN
jgi:hypothetical protein